MEEKPKIKFTAKRNPQDATNRNVRAANRKMLRLELGMEILAARIAECEGYIQKLFRKLERKRGKK